MLIGITGKAGAGKDTIGEHLMTHHNFGRTSFAYPIKQMLNALLGVDDAAWTDREWKETPIESLGNRTPRYLAQTLGTQWGRNTVHNLIWINLALEKVEGEPDLDIVITDVRFDNEAQAIKNAGGYVIDVHRLETDTESTAHASEQGIKNNQWVDFVVTNYGTIDELLAQVDKVMDSIEEIELAKVQSDDPDAA